MNNFDTLATMAVAIAGGGIIWSLFDKKSIGPGVLMLIGLVIVIFEAIVYW